MPEDALVEMVRTGALIPSDLIRADSSPDLQPASTLPGLFAVPPQSLVESTTNSEELAPQISDADSFTLKPPSPPSASPLPTPGQQAASSHVETAAAKPYRVETRSVMTSADVMMPPSQRPTAPTHAVAYSFGHDESVQSPKTTPEDLIAAWKAQRKPIKKRLAADSLAYEIESSTDRLSLDEIPNIFADEEVGEVTPVTSPSESIVVALPAEPRPTLKRPSLLSLIAPDLPALPAETFAQKRDRWLRSLPSKPVIAVLFVIALSAWWYWPRSQRHVYVRCLALWTELQDRRAFPLDKSGMDQFVARATTELNQFVPQLKRHASSNNRKIELLLSVTQDGLQPLLQRPRVTETSREKQLEGWFQELAEIYEPSRKRPPSEPRIVNDVSPTKAASENALTGNAINPAPITPPVQPLTPVIKEAGDVTPEESVGTKN